MRRECRERFPCHRLRRKQLVSDPGIHHGMCVTPWCMSGSQTLGGAENVSNIPRACATRIFTYLVRSPLYTNYPSKHTYSCVVFDYRTYVYSCDQITHIRHGCPIASYVILNEMGKIRWHRSTTKILTWKMLCATIAAVMDILIWKNGAQCRMHVT